jgi:hypothetical protein
MNANELADYITENSYIGTVTMEDVATMLRNQQALIENLNGRIERMIEKSSHYESMAHAGGFEAGRELGMKQERALWELAASTQEAYILELENGLKSSINLNKAQAERSQ